jgi:hypothetical protein
MEPVCPVGPPSRPFKHCPRLAAITLAALMLAACAGAPVQDASRTTERGRYQERAEAGTVLWEVFDKSHLDLASLRARLSDLHERRIDKGLSQRRPLQEAKLVPRAELPMRMRRALAEFVVTPLPRALAHAPAPTASR